MNRARTCYVPRTDITRNVGLTPRNGVACNWDGAVFVSVIFHTGKYSRACGMAEHEALLLHLLMQPSQLIP